jgi:PAS domain S-box-containing protein
VGGEKTVSRASSFLVGKSYKPLITLIIALLLFVVSPALFGQSYLVHHYSEADGLASSTVYDITQDHWGRMWFATRSGISRYDGVTWENYTVSGGLPATAYFKVAIDRKGRVWALAAPAFSQFNVIYKDDKGETEQGRWRQVQSLKIGRLSMRQISSFQLIEPENPPPDRLPVIMVGSIETGAYLWTGGKWHHLSKENKKLPTNTVNGIAGLNHKYYLATGLGLSVYHPGGPAQWRHYRAGEIGFPENNIKGICVEHQRRFPGQAPGKNRIWIMGDRWLAFMEEGDLKIKQKYPVAPEHRLKQPFIEMSPDYRGGIYSGILYQALYFNHETAAWSTIGLDNGLISEGANGFFIDYEKNVWIANDRGVSKISSRRFSNFRMTHGMLEDEVTAVIEYQPGIFLLGHNKGVSFWDGRTFTALSFKGKVGDRLAVCRVLDMKMDTRRNVWLALSDAGLGKIDAEKQFHYLPHPTLGQVNSLWTDKKGRVWLASNKGLFVNMNRPPDKPRFQPVRFAMTVKKSSFRKLFGDDDGLTYMAAYQKGILCRNPDTGQWENFRYQGEGKGNNTFSVFRDSRGRLLVGTLDGLFRVNRPMKRLDRFTSGSFEIRRPIYFITEDHRQRLWFGIDNGVIRWDGSGSNALRFSTPQGLVGLETNRAAGIVDSRGRVWIGTNRGLSIYDEQFDDHDSPSPAPIIRLVKLETNLRKIHLNITPASPKPGPIELDPKTHTMDFHFRGISFRDEKSVRFSYKLDGFDKEWNKEQYPYKQTVRYPNLSPGAYRFRFKARSADNVWSSEMASPRIIIDRPFYRRWWFFLLVLLAIGLLVFGTIKLFSEKRHADILEKQVEERTHQLQDAEKQYRKLFEESKDAVFIATPKGGILDINPAGIELLGGPPPNSELPEERRNLRLETEPEAWDRLRTTIEEKGFVKDYQLTLNRKDGEQATVLMTANVVREAKGSIKTYRGIIRDISQQKQLEQQLVQAQKMEAIGTLAGGIAHDFNNILGVIMGYSDLVVEDLEQGTLVRQNAEQITTAAKRAAELVKQILAFSRQGERRRKPLNITLIIEEVLKLLRSSLPATIEIHRRLRAQSAIVLADPTQVHQVMMNLCANAAHAMRDKGGLLDVSLDQVYLDPETVKNYHNIKPGQYIRLSVSDTGHGIPKVVTKRIFDPYFTTKDTGEGTGMGLAVVHGIIKSYGGDISIHSEPGKGTTFQVFLPRAEDGHHPETPQDSPEYIPKGSGHILLIDDETALAEVGKQILQRLGYTVEGKSDPIDAINIFKNNPEKFDLVITDLTMPKMTGLQIAEQVKHIKPGTPVILCSGFSAAVSRTNIEKQVDAFVMKPIIKGELARAIRKLLDQGGGF